MRIQLASIFRTINHGMYVIAVSEQQQRNAFTAAWVMQVSFQPLMLGFSINPKHYSYPILRASEACTINVLAKDQLPIANHFGQSGFKDKMAYSQWSDTVAGLPYLAAALTYFECKVSHYCPAGDHQIVVCDVIGAERLNDGIPMRYADTGNMDGSLDVFPNSLS